MSEALAIIPARGGSKGLPGKNLMEVNGVSLVSRAITVCRKSRYITSTVVSTDSPQIAKESTLAGAGVVMRPRQLSSDTSKSEEALLHVLEDSNWTQEIVVFAECTSPFISHFDIDLAVEKVLSNGCDVAFSAAPTHIQLWRERSDGMAEPIGHNPYFQTQRQERQPFLIETGAFYVFRRKDFLVHRVRFFGEITAIPVKPGHAIEIDTLEDLAIARHLSQSADAELGYFNL